MPAGTVLLALALAILLFEHFTIDLPQRLHIGLCTTAAILSFAAAPGASRSHSWLLPNLALGIAAAAEVQMARRLGFTSWWLRLALGLALGYLLLKLLVLRQYATPNSKPKQGPLLPFQANCRDSLMETLQSAASPGASYIQLEGRWGEGKTRVLYALKDALQSDHHAVVTIDVWKHQSQREIQLAILEHILRNESYLYPFGWLTYPASLLVGALLDLGLKVTAKLGSYADLSFHIPELHYQRLLEYQVGRSHRNGVRTVIVLDELDRAAPSVVQETVTLARRALDLEGVAVVLSYVPAVLDYKAFNPLAKQLPDLSSSALGILYRVLGIPKAADETVKFLRDDDTNADGWLDQTLRVEYANLPAERRRRLNLEISERYMETNPIVVPPLGADDIASILMLFPGMRTMVHRLRGGAADDESLRTLTMSALDAWSAHRWGGPLV